MIRFIIIILVLALMLSMAAFASMEASQYLTYYNAYISRSGNTVKVNFEVVGTGVMDYIGATEIYLYEKTSTYGSWTLVQTYLSTDPAYYSTMIDTNAGGYDNYVTYSGNSSYQYKASVTIYAEKNGGSDSRTVTAT